MKRIFLSVLTSLCLTFIFNGCIKKTDFPDKPADLERSLGIPIVYSRVTMADIVNTRDTSFTLELTDPVTGFYKMVLGPEKYDFAGAGTYIKIKDNTINVPSLPISNVTTSSSISYSIPIALEDQNSSYFKGAHIKRIYFSDGSLRLDLTSTLSNTVNVVVTFSNIIDKNNALPLKFTYRLSQNNTGSQSADMSNFILNLNNDNSLKFKLDITIQGGSVPPSIGNLSFSNMGITQLIWSRIEGKLGTIEFPIVDNASFPVQNAIPITPFSNGTIDETNPDSVYIYFEDPKLSINFNNSFGLPATVLLRPLKSVSKDGTVTREVTLSGFALAKPTDPGVGNPASFATSSHLIPSTSIKELIETGPKELIYGLKLVIDSTKTNFNTDYLLSDSRVSTETNMELPLYGFMKNYVIEDEIDYPLANETINTTSTSNNVSVDLVSATFKLDYTNGIPLDILLQVSFLDKNGNIIDQLYSSSGARIEGAIVNSSGVVSVKKKPSGGPIEQLVDINRYNRIKNECEKVRFKGVFSTTNLAAKGQKPTSVKFFPKDDLIIQLSVKANAVIKFNNN